MKFELRLDSHLFRKPTNGFSFLCLVKVMPLFVLPLVTKMIVMPRFVLFSCSSFSDLYQLSIGACNQNSSEGNSLITISKVATLSQEVESYGLLPLNGACLERTQIHPPTQF